MRRAMLLVLALAALGQVYFAVRAEVGNLREVPKNLAKFRVRPFRSAPDELDVQPYIALGELAGSMEPDARVLVLSDTLRTFPMEFLLLPRHVSVLAKFDASVADLPGMSEMNREAARERYEKLERMGQRFTEERLRDRIARCDYVLVYGSTFDLKGFHLREVRRLSPWIVLYRREPGQRSP